MPRTIGGDSLLSRYGSRLAVAKAFVTGTLDNDSFVWDVIGEIDIAAARVAIELDSKEKEAKEARANALAILHDPAAPLTGMSLLARQTLRQLPSQAPEGSPAWQGAMTTMLRALQEARALPAEEEIPCPKPPTT